MRISLRSLKSLFRKTKGLATSFQFSTPVTSYSQEKGRAKELPTQCDKKNIFVTLNKLTLSLKYSKWSPEPTQKNGATPKSQTSRTKNKIEKYELLFKSFTELRNI